MLDLIQGVTRWRSSRWRDGVSRSASSGSHAGSGRGESAGRA